MRKKSHNRDKEVTEFEEEVQEQPNAADVMGLSSMPNGDQAANSTKDISGPSSGKQPIVAESDMVNIVTSSPPPLDRRESIPSTIRSSPVIASSRAQAIDIYHEKLLDGGDAQQALSHCYSC